MGIFDFLRNKKSFKADESTEENSQVKLSDEVQTFLSSVSTLNNPEIGLNFLSENEAQKNAISCRQIEAFQSLSLIPLEDSNNSNSVCYISDGCASGMVMFLSHSDDSRILFDSLDSFKMTVEKNLSEIEYFEDFIDELPTFKVDDTFNDTINNLLSAPITDEAEFLLCLYLKSVKKFNEQVVQKCVDSDKIFIQETLFSEIANRPQLELFPILETDRLFHPQVERAYKEAISRIKELKNEDRF